MNGSVVWKTGYRLRAIITVLWATACSAAAAAPAATAWTLDAETWAAPRQAESLLAMPPLAAAVRALLAAPEGRLVVAYPATEEGALWGNELRDWLVSLGIESDRIQLQAATSSPFHINLSVSSAPARRNTP